jgi:FtsH-binding integral membrane protein
MQGWQTQIPMPAQVGSSSAVQAQRAFMSRVYLWMAVGLGTTAAAALFTVSTPEVFQPVMRWFWAFAIAEFGLVLLLSAMAPRLSAPAAGGLFLLYSALNGMTLSGIFLAYRLGTIGQAFLITGGVFGAMTLYAMVTRKDLSGWGTFLFMGLVGVIVAGLVNLFLQNGMMAFIINCACVVVFAGLTAYDTQKLRNHFATAYAGGGVGSLAIVGALMLYLDFVNLFLALLRLFGRER